MSGCRWYYSRTKRRGILLLFLLQLNKWIRTMPTVTGRDITSLGDRCLYSLVLATDFAKTLRLYVTCTNIPYRRRSTTIPKFGYAKLEYRNVLKLDIVRCRMYITKETYETDIVKYVRSSVARVGNRQSGIAMYIALLATRERWNTLGYRERK